jgi:glycosyltransferase involved in cell wall biosynthesis
MIVGIDASNIRAGGGLTHLSCLLQAGKFGEEKDIQRVVVWGGKQTIDRLERRDGLNLIHVPILDRLLPFRMAWQRWILPGCLRDQKCNVLYSPGGVLPSSSPVPTVVMSQNLLPFEPHESRRFGLFSFMRLKMRLIGSQQRRSMEQADGLIFLTLYARDKVLSALKRQPEHITVISHGIENRFFCEPRPVSALTGVKPFRLLYVSIVDVYKHQCHVAEAVAALRGKGVTIEVDFVGPAYGPELKRLAGVIERLDPVGEFLHYRGAIPFDKLHLTYMSADTFVFASTCENLPNILLEAMAAGLPIACSHKGPMPEVLGDAGVYFDPERPEAIAEALSKLIENPSLRRHLADAAYKSAQSYSWELCARETFTFIAKVASGSVVK